jgi:hypothetical protein
MFERLLTFLSSITILVLDILDRIKVFDARSCILVAIEVLKSLLTIAGCVLLNIAMMLHIRISTAMRICVCLIRVASALKPIQLWLMLIGEKVRIRGALLLALLPLRGSWHIAGVE